MYLVQRFEFSPIVPKKLKAATNVLMLIFGPFVLFVFIIAEAFKKVQQYGIPFFEAVKRALGRATEIVDFSHFSSARDKSSIILLDALGRNLSEVCSGANDSKDNKYTLEHVQNIIETAVEQLASDILIDPVSSDNYVVRYRIDGMLRTAEEIDFKSCIAIVNSIKAISGIDIADRRPQEGAFVAKTAEGDVSFRVASAGVLHGEKLAMRILNQAVMKFTLGNIGMDEKYQQLVKETITHKSGMILVCGQDGSGKSTTIYAMLRELDFSTRNVITIEDPIKYVLPKASQIELNTKTGITFAKTLQSVLSQNPDVISVGEIRDQEIASIAIRAAQTGRLVFGILRSSSNAAAIVRLIKLGIKLPLISSTINMVISQKLIRKLCPQCKVTANLDETQIEKFKGVDTDRIMQPAGCSYCGNTGYKGRTAIFDIMVHGDDVKAQILSSNFSVSKFDNVGDEQYRANLKKQAMKLALSGITSLEEVKRVTSDFGR
jgi:type IV pilus assembly protein PilB